MSASLLLIGVPGLFRFRGLAIRLSFSIWFARVNLCPLNAHLRVFMYNYDIVSIEGKRSFRGSGSKLEWVGMVLMENKSIQHTIIFSAIDKKRLLVYNFFT